MIPLSGQVGREFGRRGVFRSLSNGSRHGADVSVLQHLQFIAAQAGSERLVIVDGSATYHRSLLQKAKEWNNESVGLALTSGDKPAGIYAFTEEAICDLKKSYPAQAGTLEETTRSTQGDAVCHSDSGCRGLVAARSYGRRPSVCQRKLDRWLVKPTDGLYARLNRRISIPISRQLIKFPVTANMVTIFTLKVGFASGVFFAFGGYWSKLLGAILCLGGKHPGRCDGEVARLKLQESAFGCLLETVCDYLFYLFLFVGMTLGLWRSSGYRMYLICGGLLLFGQLRVSSRQAGRGIALPLSVLTSC